MLLDSGATGLFIDCAWLHQRKSQCINLSILWRFTILEGSANRGGRKSLSYYHTKDTRNALCLRCVIWENLILSWGIHGYINIIWRSTGRQEKWR